MLNLSPMGRRKYAGRQLVIDLIGAEKLNDSGHIAAALEQCVFAVGARILSRHLYTFPDSGGISLIFLLGRIAYQHSYVAGKEICGGRHLHVRICRPENGVAGT